MWSAAFFIGGVLFDILTLGRIDDLFNMAQQAIYLCILAYLLRLEFIDYWQPNRRPAWTNRFWKYHIFAMQFLFGALFSVFAIFYFKSASSWSLLAFFTPICIIMVVNELERVQQLGISFRFTLFALAVASYFSYLLPIFYGSVGTIPFTLSALCSILVLMLFIRWIRPFAPSAVALAKRAGIPAFTIVGLFVGLYYMEIIPPAPLSAKYMGIFHEVKKIDKGIYRLVQETPRWKFWHRGDQHFVAHTGDLVYCYFRIFSPTDFSDKVRVIWQRRNKRGGWEVWDDLTIAIHGGRNEGFRGYIYKKNYNPGDWRVMLKTLDGREISRLGFSIVEPEAEQSEERRFYFWLD